MYVAMLDILGYSANVDDSGYLTRLKSSIDAISVNEAELHLEAFSDTIVLSGQSGQLQRLLDALSLLHLAFLREGILVRGGLTFGRHYRQGKLTYSPALVVAHRLESQVAIVPRIVIDDEVQLVADIEHEHLRAPLEEQIAREAGIGFLHVAIADHVSEYLALAKSAYLRDEVYLQQHPNALFKHRWLQDYLLSSAASVMAAPSTPYVAGILFPGS
jgi:hypothetical protein